MSPEQQGLFSEEAGGSVAPAFVRAFVTPVLRGIKTDKREITHIISTASTDRAGDIVEPGGAEVANFIKHPVVLADHEYSIRNIIGKATSIEVSRESISATTRFHDSDLAKEAFALVKAGMPTAWSIGFRPLEHESIKDDKGRLKGFCFKRWELMEYSMVAVPCNADAVSNAIKAGIITAKNAGTFFNFQTETPSEEDAPRGDSGSVSKTNPKLYEFILSTADRWRRIARAQKFKALE